MPDNSLPEIEPSFDVIARQVHDELGGRASLSDVIAVMEGQHRDVFLRNARSALRKKVRDALTEHDASGMPHASSVDDVYVQRRLFAVNDYGSTIDRYIVQSGDLLATARRLADECVERYGVRFSVPDLDADGDKGRGAA